MKKSHFVEIIIFAVLLGAFVLAGFNLAHHLFDYGKVYHLVFKDIDSIQTGSPVRIMGVDIGYVTKTHTIYDEIYVDFVVSNPNVTIPPGTVASIQFSGLAGSRSIELTPPSPSTEFAMRKKGIIIEEPIRISAAMEVSRSFIKATMMSAKGLSTFIGDRSYNEVKAQTQKFRIDTARLDKDVATISNNVTNGGTSLLNHMENANVIMEHAYNYAQEVNDSVNFQKILSIARYSKKSIMHYKRLIDRNRKTIRHYSLATDMGCQKINNYMSNVQKLYCLNTNAKKMQIQIQNFDSKLTQENLDKIETNVEKAKTVTQKMKNSI